MPETCADRKNIYAPISAELTDVIDETPNIKTFVLKPEQPFTFATGQFVELSIPGVGEAPFTPSSDPAVHDELEITIMKAGKLTGMLHDLTPGETLGIRGPYGKGYPLEDFEGRDVLILGGGVGLAPLRSLLYALFAQIEKFNSVIIKYGARSPDDIVYKRLIDEWAQKDGVELEMTVDKGDDEWSGNVGVVTTIIKDLPVDVDNTACVVCGPPIMMKFTILQLLELDFAPKDMYLSLEKNMSCGLGKCGHCRIGPYYVCKDGPVLTYDLVMDYPDLLD